MPLERRAVSLALAALFAASAAPAQDQAHGFSHFERLAELEKDAGKPISQRFYFQILLPREVGWDAMNDALNRAMAAPWDDPIGDDAGLAATFAAQEANLALIQEGIAADHAAFPPPAGVDTPAMGYQAINMAWRTKLARARTLGRQGDLPAAFREALELVRFGRHLRAENALLVDFLNGESARDNAARLLLELAARPELDALSADDLRAIARRVAEANAGGQSAFDCWRMEMLVMRQTFLVAVEEFQASLPSAPAARVAACRLALEQNPATFGLAAGLSDDEVVERCSIEAFHRYFDEFVQVGRDLAELPIPERMAATGTQNDRAAAASPFRHGLVHPMRLAALPVVVYRDDFLDAKLRLAATTLCLRAASKDAGAAGGMSLAQAVEAAGLDAKWGVDAFIGAPFALSEVEGAPGRWRLSSRAVEELSARQAEFGMPPMWLVAPLAVEWGGQPSGAKATTEP